MKGMLPSFIKGIAEKVAIGRGIKAPKRLSPKKVCTLCTKLFDKVEVDAGKEPPLEMGRCPECEEKLKDGFVAVVAPNKLAFVKSERLKDLAGNTVQVSAENFLRIQQEYLNNWAPENAHANKPAGPAR